MTARYNSSSSSVIQDIFMESIRAVKPAALIREFVEVNSRHLVIKGRSYPLEKPCYIVGFGKAVLGMSVVLEEALGSHLQRGVVVIPSGILATLDDKYRNQVLKSPKINYIEGAKDNIPDREAMEGAIKIKNLVENSSNDDLVISLISGGGSALLPLPIPPITLEEKQNLIRNLSRRGADILELNCVRKQISVLKGGGLAELAFPARVISLVLSDIVGDPLDFIASGPTTPNKDSLEDAVNVIKKHSLYEGLPRSVREVLEGQVNQSRKLGVVIENGEFKHVDNFIIGNNVLAANKAKEYAISLGYQTVILSTKVTGDVRRLAESYATLTGKIDSLIKGIANKTSLQATLRSLRDDLHLTDEVIEEIMNLDFTRGKICLLAGGEPTVVVKSSGKGGRNQQLVLEYAVKISSLNLESEDILFLSGGTDGIDGPTDAAGALGGCNLVKLGEEEGLEAAEFLEKNDSYGFFSRFKGGKNLIKTGHTGTNVMDIHILLFNYTKS